MDHADLSEVHITAPSFVKAVRIVRANLTRAGLSIVAEVENEQGLILHVVCPLLILETLAFHRSASVFIPVHVGIRPKAHGAVVEWVHAVRVAGTALPASAARPLQALYVRIAGALNACGDL